MVEWLIQLCVLKLFSHQDIRNETEHLSLKICGKLQVVNTGIAGLINMSALFPVSCLNILVSRPKSVIFCLVASSMSKANGTIVFRPFAASILSSISWSGEIKAS